MSRNTEYTTPLQGTPYYVSTGIIQAVDQYGSRFSVGEISYQRFDDQNFQYVISPYWSMIQELPEGIFAGIPGIDLEHHKEHYYRVNLTPSFVEMRTPGPSREDLWELLEEVGLDYYDRFEWMLRAGKRCGDDNLIVVRKREAKRCYSSLKIEDLDDLQPMDRVSLKEMYDISGANKELTYVLFRLLYSGASIHIEHENRDLSECERRTMLYLLRIMMKYSENYSSIRQREGIIQAKKEGKYTGRKKIPVDRILLSYVAKEFRNGKVSEKEAMKKLGIPSRSTFYRRLKEIE